MTVAVIGAGIVGSCIAWALARRGSNVLLLDSTDPGQACSFGNSGAISPSSLTPLAMPGILGSLPKMLADPLGPLHLPVGYLPKALPWLVRFLASARQEQVKRTISSLAELHRDAVKRHIALARDVGVSDLLLQRGHLHVYPDAKTFASDREIWRLRREHGCSFEQLERGDILGLEPAIGKRYSIGVYLADHATIRNPYRYTVAVAEAAQRLGAHFVRAKVHRIRPLDQGWTLETTAQTVHADHVVVAAGAWSGRLLTDLGIRLQIESQRGYHVQFGKQDAPVTRTVVLADRKVFLTPMEEGLRVGGTVEFGGLDRPPTKQRSDVLEVIARDSFPDRDLGSCSHWMGHRPCMPNSVPAIGPVGAHKGLWLATGHGHLGLTDAPTTADRIADAIVATG